MRTLTALALVLPLTAIAAPPTLHQQGRLLDSTGQPLNGSHDVLFTLYDASSGGNEVWSETNAAVPFDNGYFDLTLGLIESLDAQAFDDNDELWVGITVDAGTELSPRTALNSVPWAMSASTAAVAHSLTPGQSLDVASIQINGTTVLDDSGLSASSSWADLTDVPSDLADGDADTLAGLSCSEGEVAALLSGTWTCTAPYSDSDAVAAIAAADTYLPRSEAYTDDDATAAVAAADTYLPRNEAYTDDDATAAVAAADTYLPRNEAYTDDDAIAALSAADGLAFDGLTEFSGGLRTEDQYGPYGWVQFTTDRIVNNPTTSPGSYKVADVRCSGHWGSYAVDIELVTYYYRPAIRHYTYYCGNGNHTGGGVLTEKTGMRSGFISGDNATIRKANVTNTGLVHSGQTVYNIELWVDQPAYVQSYMRVTSFGPWGSFPAGTEIKDSETKAVWHYWN